MLHGSEKRPGLRQNGRISPSNLDLAKRIAMWLRWRMSLTSNAIDACNIEAVGLGRNGRQRFWCVVHGSDATGRDGPLKECKAEPPLAATARVLDLNPNAFPGGVALWGSVPAIYDTTRLPPDHGVHVHARRSENDLKEIDDTFDLVNIAYKRDLLDGGIATIDAAAAVAFYLSRFVGNEVCCLFCPYCSSPHADEGMFAVRRHRKHLCHFCGRYFNAENKSVSNPLALISQYSLGHTHQDPELSLRSIDILQRDYPGGVQLWASNPAIIWLADRPEEAGLHVHAYDGVGQRVIDETYGKVTIDGLIVPVEQASYLMAQRTASWVAENIASLGCVRCGSEAFDQGHLAFEPRREHSCLQCGSVIDPPRGRTVVANPLAAKLGSLVR